MSIFAQILIILGALMLYFLYCMPGFFSKMPERKEWFVKGTFVISIYAVFYHKSNVVIQKEFHGYKLVAYIYMRLLGLKKDWDTSGEFYAISCGYKLKSKDIKRV